MLANHVHYVHLPGKAPGSHPSVESLKSIAYLSQDIASLFCQVETYTTNFPGTECSLGPACPYTPPSSHWASTLGARLYIIYCCSPRIGNPQLMFTGWVKHKVHCK